jgi:protein SCO1
MTLLDSRRRITVATALKLAGLSVLAPLAACNPGKAFHGIDVTGANWGKTFRLLDVHGQERTLADFKGKIVSLFFGFLNCPDFCPTHLTRQTQVLQLLGPDAAKVQTIFVSVDPERDTPAAIKAYLAGFHSSFIGLTASQEQLQATAREFKSYFAKAPMPGSAAGYTVDHTTNALVFDPTGQLRLMLRHELEAAQVAADLKRLMT